MLVNCDVKGLEVVVAAELSGDKVLCQEIIDKVDFHEANRKMFNLGGNDAYEGETQEEKDARKAGRLVAKTLKFRTIYGGGAWSFANDPSMNHVSSKVKFWDDILEQYFAKYHGLAKWHEELILTAKREGRLEIPSGRFYPIEPNWFKDEPWPLTVIKNYPVQGFGADLVMLARLEARRRLSSSGLECLLISTIHDSIVADTPDHNTASVGRILNESVEAVPSLCRKVFGYEFNLPLTAEVQYGKNKKEMLDLVL